MAKEQNASTERAQQDASRDRMTRREALRKLGIGSGLTAFLLLGSDDIARMVGRQLARRRTDNELVDAVARDLRNAGVAFAAPGPWSSYGGPCGAFAAGQTAACSDCNNERHDYCTNKGTASCTGAACGPATNCGFDVCGGPNPTYSALQQCWSKVCGNCLANCN